MTQAETFSDILKKLRRDVTAEDRSIAQKKFEITTATLSRYLNGDVRNNDLAALLIVFFKVQIKKRNKAINV